MAGDSNGDQDRLNGVAKALVVAVEGTGAVHDDVEARCAPLLRLMAPHKNEDFVAKNLTSKKQESVILDNIRSWKNGLLRRFFSGLLSIIELIIVDEAYVPLSAYEDEDRDLRENKAADKNKQDVDKSLTCLTFLKCSASCAHAALNGRMSRLNGNDTKQNAEINIIPEIYDVALQLHNILLSLHDCGLEGTAAKNAIMALCESWWLANAINRETLIAQVLPLQVLQASNSTEFQKSNIKKLLNFKDAFQVIDFVNPSSDSLRALLLRVASNPLCLKMHEGRKFLSSLFRDPDLVLDLHLAFRAQIPNASKTVLQAYAEIYYKAWGEAVDSSNDAAREVIELNVLQDLMHAAIHVASQAMARTLLTLLEPLHSDKKDKRVAELLNRLYGPILWRSMSAANPLVRRNAVSILGHVFPLHDPNQNHMKSSIEKSTVTLKNALEDKDPKVRVAASEATARLCVLFWDALPSADIRMLLNHIVLDHASDMTSSSVREQALITTASLLATSQSHSVLRPLLPSLGNLVHDKAEKVRLAAIKLLRRIKQTPGIHFYHVVPVDHISARFAEEEAVTRDRKNAVNKELTALMLTSYFPQGRNITASDQMQRTIAFIMTDPSAAASFYANLADYLEIKSIAKFIVMLLTCLKSAVQTEQSQQLKSVETQKKRRRAPSIPDHSKHHEQNISASNTSLMVGIAEAMCTLLESVEGALSQTSNEPIKALLQDRLCNANIPNILAHFENNALVSHSSSSGELNGQDDNFRICRAILRCASWLPKDSVPGIAEFVSHSLEAIANDGNIASIHVSGHLALLAEWGMINDIARELADSLESTLDDTMELSLLSPCLESTKRIKRNRSRSSKGRKSVSKWSLSGFPPKFACSVLNDILRGSSDSCLSLRQKLFASAKATETIHNGLSRAMKFIGTALDNQPAVVQPFEELEIDTILSCCEAFGRFALHRTRSEPTDELSVDIRFVLEWTTEHVIPVLLCTRPAGSELQDLDLSRISNVSDSLLLHESPGMISPPKQRPNLGPKSSRRASDLSLVTGLPPGCHSFADIVARSLMQSSCLILSEFLVCNISHAKEIDSHVSQWCTIFDEEGDNWERVSRLIEQLLPCFMRLAVHLCKSGCNNSFLKGLICKCDKIPSVGLRETFLEATKSLFHTNFQAHSRFLPDFTDAVLAACEQLLQSNERSQDFNAARSSKEVWSGECISTILERYSNHQKACQFLANKMISNILMSDGNLNNDVFFFVRCLSFLMSKMKSGAFVEKIIDDNLFQRPQFHEIGSIMKEIIHTAA